MNPPGSRKKHVNDLLHTLRGEQFRHAQNVRGGSSRIPYSRSFNQPTLPINYLTSELSNLTLQPPNEVQSPSGATNDGKGTTPAPCPGPSPPKSWQKVRSKDPRSTPGWRAHALSLVFPDIHLHVLHNHSQNDGTTVPSLVVLCLHILAACPDDEFIEDVIPYLNPHLRSTLIRSMAVESPLSSGKLLALLEPDGHAHGELVVVGPSASLGDDYFIRNSGAVNINLDIETSGIVPDNLVGDSWEQDTDEPNLLHTCIFMSTTLANSTVLSLPPTITHLGLINLRTSVPLHRLPGVCPLLVFLDLSYNVWLGSNSRDDLKVLERVEWTRWDNLRTLGFRDCHISDGMLDRLNKGRWDDVKIIL